ncbi:hypothetical protein COLO4_27210 [Corchorus olitorius]|uniref:Uncharacterized protein n=1 Tax=Corchorus olitorius TaxID=93759 RepID=A0A1R3HS31_9ROSI|nr:hypothetical protein COLO4_27210 [Corchorus olitorius]
MGRLDLEIEYWVGSRRADESNIKIGGVGGIFSKIEDHIRDQGGKGKLPGAFEFEWQPRFTLMWQSGGGGDFRRRR